MDMKSINISGLYSFYRIICVMMLCASCLCSAQIVADEYSFKQIDSDEFQVMLLDRKTDFSHYKKVLFFPLNIDKLTISSRAETGLKRNWRRFGQQDAPDIIELTSIVTEDVFSDSSVLELTKVQDRETLVMQVQLSELLPIAYLDSGIDTVGSEYVRQFAVVQYRIVAMDPATKEMVMLIEDVLQVRRYSPVRNNRAMHRSAWKVSYEQLMENLEKELAGVLNQRSAS